MTPRQMKILEKAVHSRVNGKPAHVPTYLSPIWGAFCDLSRTRAYTETYGPLPITYQEMAAYCAMMRLPLEPSHVSGLMALDAAWLKAAKSMQDRSGKTMAPVSQFPLTPELFDPMFG